MLSTEYWYSDRQSQQTGENRKIISSVIFIAIRTTDGGRDGAWIMCGEKETHTELPCRSLK